MPEYHVTQSKKEALEEELHAITHKTRPDILERLEAARALGDLKENAEYHAMRDLQGKNESRIREITELLKYAVIVEKTDTGKVALASIVVVQKKGSDTQQEFTLVSRAEADILENKIGEDSPLGEALMGSVVGNEACFETPKGEVCYEIIEIR